MHFFHIANNEKLSPSCFLETYQMDNLIECRSGWKRRSSFKMSFDWWRLMRQMRHDIAWFSLRFFSYFYGEKVVKMFMKTNASVNERSKRFNLFAFFLLFSTQSYATLSKQSCFLRRYVIRRPMEFSSDEEKWKMNFSSSHIFFPRVGLVFLIMRE